MARTQEADSGFMESAGLDRSRHPDDLLTIQFSLEPLENPTKSKEAGRPIFDDVEMISIRVPGDPDIRRHPVEAADRARFARHYEAWKRNENQEAVSGTPLVAWPMIKRSQVEEAKFFGLHTVEQLSDMADVNLQKLGPGWITLRQHAQDWLKKAQDGAILGKLRLELKERDERINALEDMLKRQAAELHRPSNTPALSVVQPPSQSDIEALKMQVAQLLARQATVITATEVPKVTTTTTAPVPLKKKRGRPSKAEMAAREAAKGKE